MLQLTTGCRADRTNKGYNSLGPMAKTLLSLVLAATQLLSWSAPAAYLCLAGDGAVGFDFGPTACHACQDHEHSVCCGDHDEHSTCSTGIQAPCDCVHVPVISTQGSVTCRAANTGDDARQVASSFAALAVVFSHEVTTSREPTAACPRFIVSRALLERACAVLRC